MSLFKKLNSQKATQSNQNVQKSRTSNLYEVSFESCRWPVVYASVYNISFLGVEKLHPFDSGKWGRVYQYLVDAKLFCPNEVVSPCEPTDEDLLLVHTQDYLNRLKWSAVVAQITEVPPVALIPNFIVQKSILSPLRFQTGGSIIAGKLAIHHGWAINIGGGFHHCSSDRGGGFCAYADITLLIKFAFQHFEDIKKVMIVDLDAHQGNGHARDFMNDDRVYIMDVFNRNIYPQDGYAKAGINRKVELRSGTQDDEYLHLVKENLISALAEFEPQLVVYNAGTDILSGDRLGNLDISSQGIVERDRLVFATVRGKNIPVVMLTSGGYQRCTARVIADSILSLQENGLIGPTGTT